MGIVLDPCAEGFPPTHHVAKLESKVLQKRFKKKQHAARMEDLQARHSVRDLDRWEQRVLGSSSSAVNLPQALGTSGSMSLMQCNRHSQSDSRLPAAHA